jgi:hypothetical protein
VSFIVHIIFSGLMAFIPNQDGTEVTVLLLNVDHNYHSSDGTSLPHHHPFLFARGGNCSGTCPTADSEIAEFMFADQSAQTALNSLAAAVQGGGAWKLEGADFTVRKGSTSDPSLPTLDIERNARGSVNGVLQPIPTTAAARRDFSWIADLKQICTTCVLDDDVFDAQPPAIVAARFRLASGKLFTYSVARIGSNVTPVHFNRLDGTGSVSPYSQAIATRVGADIEVEGSSIQIAETKFDGSAGRTMTLTPDASGKVEIAVLNIPPFVPPAAPSTVTPEVGKHFELYYNLTQAPPDAETRLVPRAGAASGVPSYPEVSWYDIHPDSELYSELLNKLRLDISRSMYEQILCPPVVP